MQLQICNRLDSLAHTYQWPKLRLLPADLWTIQRGTAQTFTSWKWRHSADEGKASTSHMCFITGLRCSCSKLGKSAMLAWGTSREAAQLQIRHPETRIRHLRTRKFCHHHCPSVALSSNQLCDRIIVHSILYQLYGQMFISEVAELFKWIKIMVNTQLWNIAEVIFCTGSLHVWDN